MKMENNKQQYYGFNACFHLYIHNNNNFNLPSDYIQSVSETIVKHILHVAIIKKYSTKEQVKKFACKRYCVVLYRDYEKINSAE